MDLERGHPGAALAGAFGGEHRILPFSASDD